ncbi:SLC9A6_7 [Mytilus coruscus]|uniref:Sodium/hydrogen exchanger n=1 Tax=Mytilus coruscus TaxID=42192 RepID=A0A6J8ANA3_MYTCO|nr:SLC9A6_7 [Mytilus coruscus]
MLTILTIWLFKHKRLRFLHESGLSLIYGMIVGAVIKYTASNKCDSSPYVKLNGTAYYTAPNPPAAVYLKLPQSFNSSRLQEVKYDLWGEVSEDTIHCTGSLVRAVTFDPEFFFNVLLPFIIFEAGYSMKRKHFFKNLGAIMAYAFIGTTISCVVVGGIMYGLTRLMKDIVKEFTLNDCFWFGAIISATDPVTILSIFSDLKADVDLFAFIFGESVLNDAVAIVLSSSVDSYRLKSNQEGFNADAFFLSIGNFAKIFLGAFGIGSALGCVNALISFIRDHPLLETALLFLMSYMSFQACEAAELTGIVGILFCGITQAHYTYNNLSEESKHRTKQLFELMNFLAENFVFLYIGVSIFTFQYQYWHAGFIFASVFSIIVARFCNIYPLSLLLNIGRKNKIKTSFMHMMMFSGLRGAIAYALSIRNTATTAKKLMVSSTMFIVLITVILCGGLTTPMLQWLQIRVGVDEDVEMKNIKESREGSGRGATYQSMENHNENNASPKFGNHQTNCLFLDFCYIEAAFGILQQVDIRARFQSLDLCYISFGILQQADIRARFQSLDLCYIPFGSLQLADRARFQSLDLCYIQPAFGILQQADIRARFQSLDLCFVQPAFDSLQQADIRARFQSVDLCYIPFGILQQADIRARFQSLDLCYIPFGSLQLADIRARFQSLDLCYIQPAFGILQQADIRARFQSLETACF